MLTLFAFFGLLPLLWGLGLAGLFAWQSLPVWRVQGLGPVTGTRWFFRADLFGAVPMVFGTLAVAFVALLLAAPVGIGAAACAHVYLRGKAGMAAKALLELLAAVPSVVYGLLGVMVLREWMAALPQPIPPIRGDSLLTAGVLLAVMVLPTVASLADDAFRCTPYERLLAARGLGLRRIEAFVSVSLPAAGPGLLGAVMVALGRGIGETIAVFMVVGRLDNQPPAFGSLWTEGQTLATKLGGPEIHLAESGSLHWAALMSLAVLLLVSSLLATGIGMALRGRTPA